MVSFLLIALSLVHLATACQRELRSLKTGQLSHQHPLVLRQAVTFPPVRNKNEDILHESFSAFSIDDWSSYYTHGDHVAGRNRSMAEVTAKEWTKNGVPGSLVEYEVFLNYPKEQKLVLRSRNRTLHEAQMYEDALSEDDTTSSPQALPAFHGYSASGKVEAEYVYVGRGHKDDFAALTALNVDLKGKIALAKYGGPFRGVKVLNAETHGMVGVFMFSDPGDDGPQEAKGQRGSVAYIHHYPGDPTTPGYPSKPGVKHVSNPPNLPKIPSLPISHRDALPFLKALDGHGTSGELINRDGWNGGLDATYSTGPAPGITVSLTNFMEEKITPIWDVIGTINGTNPDETIVIGNHRDAWIVGGAADPNSGSAILVELTKAFGKLLESGWKPRRNIILASWDAEEYALIGSTEWVEERALWLSTTALTYLNVDIGVAGPLPGVGATPELRTLAQDIMKKVEYGKKTLYDAWNELYMFRPEDNGFTDLGSGSDYTAFLQLGIGALDFGMDASRESPVYHYHSNYDLYHWMKSMVDPDFAIHATVGRFIALLAYHLADDALIPFDMDTYARNINYWIRELVGETMGMPDSGTVQRQIKMSELAAAGRRLRQVATDFTDRISDPSFLDNAARLQKANRVMKDVQRLFVRQEGLPGRQFYKNGLYAPNRDDGYKAQTLPASMEALQDRNLTLCLEWNVWLTEAVEKAAELLAGV
ncbi:putative glutamate carboxypeptidase [Alternaria tenuissima]|uniref:Glutamate carboxypeptidase n=1 Tax=Alternaria tenuissima TaxID=119927 RepID=A0ABY0FV37_9PLEO|nr:putative glutamate carboxypeptidase [Alternaria tenuissima]RYO06937.1 putative glutamate carboxypeptidase [Alternaria tenuissima]